MYINIHVSIYLSIYLHTHTKNKPTKNKSKNQCVYVCVHATESAYGDQMTPCVSPFSPSTVCISEIKLRSLVLAASSFTP